MRSRTGTPSMRPPMLAVHPRPFGTGPADPVALADEVTDGAALDAPADAGRPPAHLRHGEDDAGARQVLVGDRHDRLGRAAPARLHADGVARVDEVDPGAV